MITGMMQRCFCYATATYWIVGLSPCIKFIPAQLSYESCATTNSATTKQPILINMGCI